MKTCPLILPPEFHPRDQKLRYEFRKELSDQWTLSFSHGQAARRAHHAHKSTNSVSKKNNRKTVTSNPKLVKHKYSNKRMAWSMDKDNTIVLEEDKNMTNEVDNHQNTDNDVDIAHLNGLVHELQTILSSDFMAKSVEDEIIEKVRSASIVRSCKLLLIKLTKQCSKIEGIYGYRGHTLEESFF